MSRFYSMGDFEKIKKVYSEEWADDTGFRSDEGAMFGAEGTLCGGESEDEAHDRIRDAVKKVVPDCSVTTQWTYLEDLPYEEYTD